MSGTATTWHRVLRRYIAASLGLHAGWEIVQLPLYTLWTTEPWPNQAFAVAHCTLGDAMIAALSLVAALCLFGTASWPQQRWRPVWAATVLASVGYTVYSEWMNVTVRASWAYSPAMPTLPWLGTGLSPLLQWIVIPTLALHWTRKDGD